MAQLQDRVTVVTGGGRGIGRAVVERLVSEGSCVFAVSRSRRDLEEIARDARDRGGRVIAHVADVRDPHAIDQLRDRVLETHGRIDLLVNNAGVGHYGLVDELSPEQWDEMMDINLKGAFLCCRAFIPAMKAACRGQIINIASVAGLVTFPRGAGYCASKWGLIALTETLMQELKPYEIKVSVVCPGSVQTNFGGTPPKSYALKPEDVAEIVTTIATRSPGVILNRVVMRPLVPREYQ